MKRNHFYKTGIIPKIFISLVLSCISLCVSSQESTRETGATNSIHEEKFVLINGIEQWVTIHGKRTKPVILFIHGGPGSPISPYSKTLYGKWEKDFIIVQWDQRGTGKTYGRNAPEELTPEYLNSNPLTIDQMTTDGIELSKYLLKQLRKQKLILFGTSWGSVLGVTMATRQSTLFYAYVGHSQIVDPGIDSILYNKVYGIAQNIQDTASLTVLTTIGEPPYDKARDVGQLMRVVKKYERANSIPAPDSWFVTAPAYDSPKDNQHRSDGDDYSFVNFTGDKRLGVESMSAKIKFLNNNVEFKIPVFLIQGNEDLLTPKEKTKKYFDKIKAPRKKYILLPKTAHGFNKSVLESQYRIFKAIKT